MKLVVKNNIQSYFWRFDNNYWLRVFIDEEDKILSLYNDWGSYIYQWTSIGEKSFKQFISTCDNQYLINKLVPKEERREFDVIATKEYLQKDILYARRTGDMSKEEARYIWSLLCNIIYSMDIQDFITFVQDNDELYDFVQDSVCYKPTYLYEVFDRLFIPAIKEQFSSEVKNGNTGL